MRAIASPRTVVGGKIIERVLLALRAMFPSADRVGPPHPVFHLPTYKCASYSVWSFRLALLFDIILAQVIVFGE